MIKVIVLISDLSMHGVYILMENWYGSMVVPFGMINAIWSVLPC